VQFLRRLAYYWTDRCAVKYTVPGVRPSVRPVLRIYSKSAVETSNSVEAKCISDLSNLCDLCWLSMTIIFNNVLARALQDLSDRYCQSTCLSACVCVCLFVCPQNWRKISRKTKRFRGSYPIGRYKKVPMAHRFVTASTTSRDSMTSYSKPLNSETRARINYMCGPFKHTLKKNIVLKRERIRFTPTTSEEEALHTGRNSAPFHNQSSPFGVCRLSCGAIKKTPS